ncbi:MAG: rhodanese-like domain-containing protein [Bryobacteraceae bacterium]
MLFSRRSLFDSLLAALVPLARNLSGDESQSDPWSARELLPPAALAKILEAPGEKPAIICVAFPFLYRQKHIVAAKFAGPASKTEGIAALKQAVAPLPHDAAIVLYCGCCPIVRCPNIRPAFRALKELGYTNVRVLNLASSFRADWEDKGYPVSSRS